jgi:adenylate cyclase
VAKRYKRKTWVRTGTSTVVFFAALLLLAFLDLLPWFSQLERATYDFVFQIRSHLAPSPEIVIVSVDESSQVEIGPLPWPRSMHARLLGKLKEGGARAAVFDVLFDLATQPEEDLEFARAIADFGIVVLARDLSRTSDPKFVLEQTIDPLPVFFEGGATAGFIYTSPDVDTKIRRAFWFVNSQPTLATEALFRVKGERVNLAEDGVRIGDQRVPADFGGSDPLFTINYVGPSRTIPTRSYYQVLDGTIPPGFLKDKIVFIGADLAAEPGKPAIDRFPTPVDEDTLMPGVEIHANALNTILSRSFIRTASPGVIWSILTFLAALTTFYMLFLRPLRAGAATALTVVVAGAAVYWIFVTYNYWLPSVKPTALIALIYGGNTLLQYRTALRERAQIQSAFKHYVSAEVLGELLRNPESLGLGGREVEATVIFTDIAGFSKISERISPQELTAMLNQYFELLATVIMKEHGMVNKFIGDAVMAIWGAPLDNPDHAAQACRASLKMYRAMIVMDPVKCRIGINTGKMVAGNMGSRERFEYTVIGDAVNLASRLEGVNKAYGTDVMISEMTEEKIRGQFLLREVDSIRVVGKARPVRIYQLLDTMENKDAPEHERWSEMIRSFQPAFEAYRNREWELACGLFAQHMILFPEDTVGRLYIRRCETFIATPPEPAWDGVFQMETK